jgi:hypothetical protein
MRLPEFLKPGRGIPRMMSSSFILFAAIIIIGLALEYGYVDLGNENEVVLELQALPRNGDIIPLQVSVQLINRTDNLLELTAPSPCKVFKWVLVDSRREFVQAKREAACPQVVMNATLEGNHNTTETFTLDIDATRLRDDTSYELRVSYWGIMANEKVDLIFDTSGVE